MSALAKLGLASTGLAAIGIAQLGLARLGLSNTGTTTFPFTGASMDMSFYTGQYQGVVPSQLTVSRATPPTSYANDNSGNWLPFAANTPRITNQGLLVEESRANVLPNNSMQGAAVGTPGTLPTNWSYQNPASLTTAIIATGTDPSGVEYVDIRISGTAGSTTLLNIFTSASTGNAASNGQTWTASAFLALVAGSQAGFTSIVQGILGYDAGGTFVSGQSFQSSAITLSSAMTRNPLSATLSNATVANVRQALTFNFNNGAVIDCTIRVGWPQLELGAFATSPIRTTTVAVTRAADDVQIGTAVFSTFFSGGSNGTFYVEGWSYGSAAVQPYYSRPLGVNANDRIDFDTLNATQINIASLTGGATQFSQTYAGTFGAIHKMAMAYATNNDAAVVDGIIGATATTANSPALTRMHVGQATPTGNSLNGWVRRIAYFPTRLTNASLQILTSPISLVGIPQLDGVYPSMYANFATGVYFGCKASDFAVTRATQAYGRNADGSLTLFGSGQAILTTLGNWNTVGATNLLLQSQTFDNASWAKNGSSIVTPDQITAPDGTLTADLWTRTVTTSSSLQQNVVKAASPVLYTLSYYLKQGNSRYAAICGQGTFPFRANGLIDFQIGTITPSDNGGSSGTTAALQPLGNGFYRASITFTSDSTALISCFVSFNNNGVAIDGTDSQSNSNGYLWGAQIETGSYASPYIPTTTVAATRNAETILMSGAAFSAWYGPGVLYAKYFTEDPTTGIGHFAADIDDNGTNNEIFLNLTTTGAFSGQIKSGGSTLANLAGGAYVVNTPSKSALLFTTTNALAYANGVSLGSVNPGALPVVSQLNIGSRPGPVTALNGAVQEVAFYPVTSPTAGGMAALTT